MSPTIGLVGWSEVFVNSVRVPIGCFTVFMMRASLFSQGSAGRILGSITDQTGAIIPGVTVTIRDVDRGTSRTLVTDEAGVYNAPNLLPGTYTIRVELSGFASAERPNIKLEVGQDIRVDISLRGGPDFTDPSAAAGTSFGFRPQTPDVTSSNPVLGSGGHRAIQLGLKIIF